MKKDVTDKMRKYFIIKKVEKKVDDDKNETKSLSLSKIMINVLHFLWRFSLKAKKNFCPQFTHLFLEEILNIHFLLIKWKSWKYFCYRKIGSILGNVKIFYANKHFPTPRNLESFFQLFSLVENYQLCGFLLFFAILHIKPLLQFKKNFKNLHQIFSISDFQLTDFSWWFSRLFYVFKAGKENWKIWIFTSISFK